MTARGVDAVYVWGGVPGGFDCSRFVASFLALAEGGGYD